MPAPAFLPPAPLFVHTQSHARTAIAARAMRITVYDSDDDTVIEASQSSEQVSMIGKPMMPHHCPRSNTCAKVYQSRQYHPHPTVTMTDADYETTHSVSSASSSVNPASRSRSHTGSSGDYSCRSRRRHHAAPQHFKFTVDDIDQALTEVDLDEWFATDGEEGVFDDTSASDDSGSDGDDDSEMIDDEDMPTINITMRHSQSTTPVLTPLSATHSTMLIKPKLFIFTGATLALDEEPIIDVMSPQHKVRKSKRPQHFTFHQADLARSMETVSKELTVGHWTTFPKSSLPVCDVRMLRAVIQAKQSQWMRLELEELMAQQREHHHMQLQQMQQQAMLQQHSAVTRKLFHPAASMTTMPPRAVPQSQCMWARANHSAKVAPIMALSQQHQPLVNTAIQRPRPVQVTLPLAASVSALNETHTHASNDLMNDSEVKRVTCGANPRANSDPSSSINSPLVRPAAYHYNTSQSFSQSINTSHARTESSPNVNSRKRHSPSPAYQPHHRSSLTHHYSYSHSHPYNHANYSHTHYAAQHTAYEMSLYNTWQQAQQQPQPAKTFEQLAANPSTHDAWLSHTHLNHNHNHHAQSHKLLPNHHSHHYNQRHWSLQNNHRQSAGGSQSHSAHSTPVLPSVLAHYNTRVISAPAPAPHQRA